MKQLKKTKLTFLYQINLFCQRLYTACRKKPTYQDENLLFEDTFSGKQLDGRKWRRCPRQYRHGVLDVWDHDMSYLDGEGHLVLRAEWDEKNHCVRSGAVDTNGRFLGGFGYYEASICFPVSPGTWGAFWLMCGNVFELGGGVEIDVVESIFNERGECNAALHWDGYQEHHKTLHSGSLTNHNIYDGRFHTFALNRTEEAYTFYIDGKEIWQVTPDRLAPCADGGYMLLSVEGADWAGTGSPECIKALPSHMLVDYVRVYKHKPE